MFDISKHKAIMVQILKNIYQDVNISSYLGFKGGTACYFFHDLPRFSVDLDFDLLDNTKKELIFSEVRKILEKYGEIKDEQIKNATIFFLLSYGKGEKKVKIEISIRGWQNKYEVLDYLGISMKIMSKEDIFANKLVALTNRNETAMRDLFDLQYFFSKSWEINAEIIQERTGKDQKAYLEYVLAFIEKLDDANILQGLGELISEKQKAWVKSNLKKDLIFQLKLRISLLK